jgi:DNA polymerase III subunit gamma/tau
VALIDDAVDALAAGDAAALFGAVEAVMDAGHDPRRFATDLLECFRDLIVLQAVPDAIARGVVDGPADVLERMREQATKIGTATLTRFAEVVHAGLGEMRGATAPRLLLEVVCARLLLPSASDTESALLQRVERIENRLDVSIPASDVVPAPKSYARKSKAPEPSQEPKPAPTPEPAGEPAPEPEPPPSAPLAKRIVEQRNSDILREALKDALGVDWKIRCEAGTAAPPAAAPEPESIAVPPPPPRDDDEEDMLAEAGNDTSETPRRDPEEAALELLQNELGARRIDGG